MKPYFPSHHAYLLIYLCSWVGLCYSGRPFLSFEFPSFKVFLTAHRTFPETFQSHLLAELSRGRFDCIGSKSYLQLFSITSSQPSFALVPSFHFEVLSFLCIYIFLSEGSGDFFRCLYKNIR